MKRLKIWLVFAMFLAVSFNEVKAQVDSLFWFAAPWVTPDHDNNTPVSMRFSSFGNATTVRVRQPLKTLDTSFVIPANSLFSLALDSLVDDIESMPADMDISTGIEITSDELMTVVYDFISDTLILSPGTSNNPETYSLKGQNGMGKEFVVPFQTLWNNQTVGDANGDGFVTQPKQYFSVVATEDNTVIYITPKCDVVGHPANITYSVTLPFAGSVYTCQNVTQTTNAPGNSLAGTVVVSDKDISITMNDDSVNPSGGGSCYDLMGDQIVPVDVVGTDYNVNKGFLNPGSDESMFITATRNFTTVNIQDGVQNINITMNQGDTYQFSITQQLNSVQSDKPVYVIHMSGYGCELGIAIIPPLNCSGSEQVSFTRNNDNSFLLNIVTPFGSEGNFTLNGSTTLVPASAFNLVPGTGGAWMGAQISFNTTDIGVNTSNLIQNSSDFFSIGVINGSATGGCLYHYMSSFVRKVEAETAADETLCSGVDTVRLSGTIKGAVSTGIWTTTDGTGDLLNPTNLDTDYVPSPSDYDQGLVTFVLTSTGSCLTDRDTLRISFVNSPEVEAGNEIVLCKNNLSTINISGTVIFAATAEWSGGDGVIGNVGNLSTTYTPSQNDIDDDSVMLYLESLGSLNSCPNVMDSIKIVFTEPASVFAGPNRVVCSSTDSIDIQGIISGVSNTGFWTTTGTGDFSPSQNDLVTSYYFSTDDTLETEIQLILTSTDNDLCLEVKDSILIQMLDRPIVNITSQDSVCADLSSLSLDGVISGGFNSVWSTNGAGSIDDEDNINTDYNISLIDTTAGFIDVFLSSEGSCPVEQDSMRVFFVAPPKVDAGSDVDLCLNTTINLAATSIGGASGYSWSTSGTGDFLPSNNVIDAEYVPSSADASSSGVQLNIIVNNSFGCAQDEDSLLVNFLPVPTAAFGFTNVCAGTNLPFVDNSTFPSGNISNWDWSFGDNLSSGVEDPLHQYETGGIYEAMLVVTASNGCKDSITQTVDVYPNPIPFFNSTVACVGEEFVVNDASFISTGTIVSWSYDFAGLGTSLDPNSSFSFNVAGDIPVTLTTTSLFGCSADTTVLINVLPSPIADFSINETPALLYEDIYFDDLSTGDDLQSWVWDFGDGQNAFGQNVDHSYDVYGTTPVTLTITDVHGCTDTIQKNISITLKPVLPLAFSPNGDGENDVFIIRGGPFKSVAFNIYNNWGQLIYTSTDENEGWDGTYNDAPSALGVYTWTFIVETLNDEIVKETGDVTLIR
jgi:gliding motility-associated-like protein